MSTEITHRAVVVLTAVPVLRDWRVEALEFDSRLWWLCDAQHRPADPLADLVAVFQLVRLLELQGDEVLRLTGVGPLRARDPELLLDDVQVHFTGETRIGDDVRLGWLLPGRQASHHLPCEDCLPRW